jgi:glycogen synthase
MKILLAAGDLTPLISSDPLALAGTIPSLPVALQRAGHEVSVVGPLAGQIAASPELKIKPTGVKITVPLGAERVTVEVREARSPQGIQLFLLQDEAALAGHRQRRPNRGWACDPPRFFPN